MNLPFKLTSGSASIFVEVIPEPDDRYVFVTISNRGPGAETIRLRKYDALRLVDALKEAAS